MWFRIAFDDIEEAALMNEVLKELISHIELPVDQLAEQDPEITEIFIEEVQEILENLAEMLPSWINKPDQPELLKDIRRSFHTLKGSGRMAGAKVSGELAWSIEELLNRVMAGSTALNQDIQHLVYSVSIFYDILVQDFLETKLHEVDLRPWILTAQHLRDGVDIESDLRYTIDYHKDRIIPQADAVTEAPVTQEEQVQEAVATATEEIEFTLDAPVTDAEVNESAPVVENTEMNVVEEIVSSAPVAELDQVDEEKTELANQMMEIFLEESHDHLNTISDFLKLKQDPTLEEYNELIRAIHTIRGSSGMVEIESIFAASTCVENVFKNLSQEEGEKHTLEHQLLLDYYEYVKSYATVLAEDQDQAKFKQLDEQFDVIWKHYEANSESESSIAITQGLVAKLLDLNIDELLDAEFAFADQIQAQGKNYLKQLLEEAHTLSSQTQLRQTESLNQIANYLIRAYQGFIAQKNLNTTAAVVQEMQQLHQYLIDAFDGLASGQNVVVTHLMAEEFESLISELTAEKVVAVTEEIAPITEVVEQDTTVTIEQDKAESILPTAITFDPDLLEIFLEESDELVTGMDNDFTTWENQPEDTQVLNNLFRYLHTLKGGANMVQATHLGDIAHELESIYERVLKGSLHPNASTMQTIRYAQDEIATRLQRLRDYHLDEPNPELIASLRAILVGAEQVAPVAEPVIEVEETHAVEELVDDIAVPIAPVSEISSDVVHVEDTQDILPEPNTAFDTELLGIFLEESDELIAGMDEDFATWEENPKNIHVLNNLFRYLHTLKGGANMVQASHLGDIAHELESIYERVLKGMIKPSASAMQTIRYAQDDIATRLQILAEQQRDEANPTLIAQLRAIVLGEAEVSSPEIATHTPIEEVASETIPPVLARAMQSGDESKIIIAQSFYEEAEELLEEGKALFAQWVVERNNRIVLLGLQRIYHTLKGNSRIIDEQLISVMAYQLESTFEQFSIREFTSDRYDALLRHTQDWLKDAIFKGRFEGAEALKARLQAISYEDSLIPTDIKQATLSDAIEFDLALDVNESIQGDGSEPPAMYAEEEEKQEAVAQEQIRISADLVEKMIDLSGENAINRSRIELDLGQMTYTLNEMELAIHRLADQLRRMEGELEAQILAKHEGEGQRYVDFDPLEMDQYSSLNQLSKSLAESASDLIDFKATLADKIRDTENLLLQQSRIQNELQQSLMGTRLVPFSRLVPRLQRLVRQTSTQLNRPVELNIENTEGELDRNILERLVNPLEHMLRNAIDHGIEDQATRAKVGKAATGRINLNIAREGNDILVIFSDDGAGINVDAVKTKAQNNGLITADMHLSDVDIMQYIFHPGLSTAQKVTQISGRGVGLDVVQNEIKSLGGHVSVTSQLGVGTEFIIRVPTTVAVSNALMVKVGEHQFALPLAQIERIVRVSPVALMEYYEGQSEQFELDQVNYRLRYVGEFITGHLKPTLSNMGASVPVIIYNSGGRSVALQVDQLIGSRAQIVIKPIGQQLSSVGFVGGATILADGRVCLILDGQTISRRALTTPRPKEEIVVETSVSDNRTSRRTIMVVDDSVTVRKVTSRLLERHGFDVIAAKDGVDALEKLAQVTPDLMLLDIEMPRMDGFEVAQYVRHDSQQRDLPIIMITSRTGEKHRERAFSLGVNNYMGKPFQEAELLENIQALLNTEQAN